MKIKDEHYSILKESFTKVCEHYNLDKKTYFSVPLLRQIYFKIRNTIEFDINNPKVLKDNNGYRLLKYIPDWRRQTMYMNDIHFETALKSIAKEYTK